ncbi:hypothetical protein VTL71DRAFT_16364 [Oculimacula yallundae]|uniref:Gfd2/YDR514C-like C-terminal domain-containing protein n=1 Tax=Oculimacula yallundae TaxID=86028 RepID=A0ABR4CGB5_9HELO
MEESASTRKPHQGLRGEDTLSIRKIFNFLEPGRSPAILDTLLVSIDVKGHPDNLTKENGQYNIGISILDTRDLSKPFSSRSQPSSPIQTHHYVVGSEKYFKETSWSFAFGTSTHATLSQIQSEVRLLVAGRDTILIVHCGNDDRRFLEVAEIAIKPLFVIDTQKAAQYPLDLDYRCNLQQMLPRLGIEYREEMLDNTGNVANYTLRAMLLLAMLDTQKPIGKEEKKDKGIDPSSVHNGKAPFEIEILERIAKDHIPVKAFERQLEAEEKRLSKTALARRTRRNNRKRAEKTVTKLKGVQLPSEDEIWVFDQIVAEHGLGKLWLRDGEVIEGCVEGVGDVRVEWVPKSRTS